MKSNSNFRAADAGFRLYILPVVTLVFAVLFSIPHQADASVDVLFGWPRQMQGDAATLAQCPTVFDFDNTSDWEIAYFTSEGYNFVYQHDGAFFPSFPIAPYQGNRPSAWVNPQHNSTSATGDIDMDGRLDLIYLTDIGYLHVVTFRGIEPAPFPIDIGIETESGVPVVADIDDNNIPDILFNSYSTHPDSVDNHALLHVINAGGEMLDGFPVSYPRGSSSSPVLGNIDGEPGLEIVIGNARYLNQPARVFAWHINGEPVNGFPAGQFETINSTPVLADLDNDGALEVILNASEFETDDVGIYALNGSGELLNGFPFTCETGHPDASPTVADLDMDMSPEIIFGTHHPDGNGRIYIWQTDAENRGQVSDGYPLELDRNILGSVLVADVTGDREVEIIAALSPTENQPGIINAFHQDGGQVEDFPIDLADYGNGTFSGMPTIWDVDQDWDLDIIAITTDRRIFVWDTPGQITENVWLTFKGDMQRRGMRPADDPNSVSDGDSGHLIPDDIRVSTYPNPFNSTVQLRLWTGSKTRLNLSLVDINGRMLVDLGTMKTTNGIVMKSLDAEQLNLTAGTYFIKVQSGDISKLHKILFLP